jgi:hypothetical protein
VKWCYGEGEGDASKGWFEKFIWSPNI